MKRRCPHCQTTPLREDADTCWYCGKDYASKRRPHHNVRRLARPASLPVRRQASRATSVSTG